MNCIFVQYCVVQSYLRWLNLLKVCRRQHHRTRNDTPACLLCTRLLNVPTKLTVKGQPPGHLYSHPYSLSHPPVYAHAHAPADIDLMVIGLLCRSNPHECRLNSHPVRGHRLLLNAHAPAHMLHLTGLLCCCYGTSAVTDTNS